MPDPLKDPKNCALQQSNSFSNVVMGAYWGRREGGGHFLDPLGGLSACFRRESSVGEHGQPSPPNYPK